MRSMPGVTPQQWRELDIVARWLVATRASVFVMTLSSGLIGALLAVRAGHFDIGLAGLCILGLVFAHASNNLLNDMIDSARGIDKGNYYRNQYGVHVLEAGLITPAQMRRTIAFTGGVALLIGAMLVVERGGITLALMAGGAFFVVFYTWPLKYIGLGEPAVLLAWGPLMVGGTFYVITGFWQWQVILISLMYALAPTSVLFGKHIDKLAADKAKGVNSLPVLLGEKRARRWVIAMLALQYGLVGLLVALQILAWPAIIVFFSLPKFFQLKAVFEKSKPQSRPAEFPKEIWPLWFAAYAFSYTRQFGLLFVGALLAEVILF